MLWELERTRKNFDILVERIADPRWQVAVHAVSGLPDTKSQIDREHVLWKSLDADVRARLSDVLLDWWDEVLRGPEEAVNHKNGRVLPALMGTAPSPRYLARKHELTARRWASALQVLTSNEANPITPSPTASENSRLAAESS